MNIEALASARLAVMGEQEIKSAVALAAVEIEDYLDGAGITAAIRARVVVAKEDEVWDALNQLIKEQVRRPIPCTSERRPLRPKFLESGPLSRRGRSRIARAARPATRPADRARQDGCSCFSTRRMLASIARTEEIRDSSTGSGGSTSSVLITRSPQMALTNSRST